MITDEALNDPIFSGVHDNDENFYANIENHLGISGIEFPSFVTFEPVKPVVEISWTEAEGYKAEGIEGEWHKLDELADHIERDLGFDVSFHDTVKESPEVEDDLGGMIFMKPRRGSGRMLFAPVDHRRLAVAHFYQFLKGAKAWLDNQDDLILAYYFLEHHPVFWYRNRTTAETRPHAWITDHGLKGVWIGLSRKDNGENVIMLEHGAAVQPDRVMHYHDPRLDVWAPTFDDAYIQLAKKVHQYFTLDGEERPEVPYTPQPWETEVAARLDAYNKAQQEEDSE